MAPITRFPPPTKLPNVCTTTPGFPVDRISLVDDTFNEIRNIVVNKRRVGKNDISRTSFTKRTLNRIISAIPIFIASITSKSKEGIGMIKNITAQSKYKPTPISAFFTII